MSARASLRKVKRRERRAPETEFGERFPRVGAPRLSGADGQPWADGFESRWDSRTETKGASSDFRQKVHPPQYQIPLGPL